MLFELLRSGAADAPDQPVLLSPAGSLTYAQALARSRAISRGLQSRSIDRFACVIDDFRELLVVLCAATLSRSEACVYPDTLTEQWIEEFASRLKHDTLVTDRQFAVHDRLALTPSALLTEAGEPTGVREPAAEAMPVLILTTGTTGRPKAARYDWARLVASTRQANEPPGARWLLAYNAHQFAAMQVLLHVLVNRATLVVPGSRRPRDTVAAVREHQVTHVSATPTFWRLLLGALHESEARELGITQITLGGEAVPDDLLRRLSALFPNARISQVYASTEFGSSVSVHDGRNGLPLSILARDADSPVHFRIVDGQLYVRSRIGMEGYWGERKPDSDWRPTGDMVEIRGDRIQFVGRAGDTINVGGVKVHPLPVEEIVAAVDGVELARAYGRANPVTGQIVAVDVVPGSDVDLKQLEQRVRQACSSLGPAARPRRIRFVPELEIRGHKIVRATSS